MIEVYDDSDMKEYHIRKREKREGETERAENQEKNEESEGTREEAPESSMGEEQTAKDDHIRETGALSLQGKQAHRIELLTVIGEIEGHESVAGNTKATKYEHLLPRLAEIENSQETDGVLILLNTMGGDVEAGLAIAEMIASLSKPTVSLVLGGSHSIGGPLAVSADYSFIVPSGTMIIHPVRTSGMFIGVAQSLRNMEKTQDRITGFLAAHSRMSQERIEELMLDPTQLVKDVGTMLEGGEAVEEGLIDEVGGISDAFKKLHEMIDEKRKNTDEN
ncbi:ATP-dependent Clp protease proteolytic subunit [Candidatus Bariatricus faecipullorum]